MAAPKDLEELQTVNELDDSLDDSPPVETSDTNLPEEGDDQKAGENIDAPTVEEEDLVDISSEEDEN